MADLRFPLQRLPSDLHSEVLKAMELHEIIFYSLISKKACSMVMDLCLLISSVQVTIEKHPQIVLKFGPISINFELTVPIKHGRHLTTLDDVGVRFHVSMENDITHRFKYVAFFESNEEMSVGEYIQRLCLISHNETSYVAEFNIGEIELEVESLRDIFLKFRNIAINYYHVRRRRDRDREDELNEQDILSVQNAVKAFLPNVRQLKLDSAPLGENLSLQHIGMANLEELKIMNPRTLKLDDLLTLNVENCGIVSDEITLRDLNRFFKLWMQGSDPKLRNMSIWWKTAIIIDWNVLLKGLKAKEEAGEEGSKKFIIQNSHRVHAEIENDMGENKLAFSVFD
ncbi:hypothetical protein L5515_005091 [Caenorhabditis briggsae]|uniref:F-box domain-containing protein n=1 Tax=Caenorhabditis briggsae TaxID=6238 RepID=A0AAE9EPK2_CAEBR|nr:hypothetical protein L5515_005091 [Caenorhabditis briggsae]